MYDYESTPLKKIVAILEFSAIEILTQFISFHPQAKAATGNYREAVEQLNQITDPYILQQPSFNMILSKCHILCGHSEEVSKHLYHFIPNFINNFIRFCLF